MTLERHGLGYIGSLSATDIMTTAASIFSLRLNRRRPTAQGTSLMGSQQAAIQLTKLINGFQVSQIIHVAASLGRADRLRDGIRPSADIAAEALVGFRGGGSGWGSAEARSLI